MVVRLLLLVVLGGSAWWAWRRVTAAFGPLVRRRPGSATARVPAALRGGGEAWVVFSPTGAPAGQEIAAMVAAARPGERVVLVDPVTDADLAARWSITRVPTTLRTASDGRVEATLVGIEAVRLHLGAGGAGHDSSPLGG